MPPDETSDPGPSRRRSRRLGVGIAGWAILAVIVVAPFAAVAASAATSALASIAPTTATVVAPGTVDDAVAVILGATIGASILGLALVAITRTGPTIGRLAHPRRPLRAYLVEVGAAFLVCSGSALAIASSSGAPDPGFITVGTGWWLAAALFHTIAFVIAPVAAVTGVVGMIERARGRLPTRVVVIMAAGAVLGCLGLQLLLGLLDPMTPPWTGAALTAVQLGAFVCSRSTLAILLPQLALGPVLLALPELGLDGGFAAGTLILGLAVALGSRLRLRTVDVGPAS